MSDAVPDAVPDARATPAVYRSKTVATWIAFAGGALGLHRFYLRGFRDGWGWLFVLPTLVGLYGVQRMRHLGADDQLAWVLIPFAGVSISAAMFTAILYGLMPDERWRARHDRGGVGPGSGWVAILGVIAALIVGGIVLVATIAFGAQRYFEHAADARSDRAGPSR